MRVVHSPQHRAHDARHQFESGRDAPYHEVPERVDAILAALEADGGFAVELPTEHGLAPIEAVHDPDLVAYLTTAWEDWARVEPDVREAIPDTFRHAALREGMERGRAPRTPLGRLGYWCFDSATPMVEGSYAAARSAVDVALTATDLVLAGDPCAYGLCRPPGHHVPHAAFGGFCFFNNASIAAQHALDAGADRVAVLDVDYHHGNGTQQLFYGRGEVLTVSLHADPDRAYPYLTGFADEIGAGAGRGTNQNVLLPVDCDDRRYLQLLDEALGSIDAFDPELVIVSLGLDTYHLDPYSDLQVTRAAFWGSGTAVAALERPFVVLQEGGYHLPDLGANALAWLRGASGVPAA